MSFVDIKGQDRAILFLKDAISNNRVAHAYIFVGPGGVGKKLTALNFAKALDCASPFNGESCDQCVSCKKIDSLNHPDLSLVKVEKERSEIRIERIRYLIRDIYLKPYEGKRKVYIIDDAHLLNEESSNAILKTLEEPPSASVLVLITDKLSRLFSTIVSRSQVVRFSPFGTNELKDMLVARCGMNSAKAQILSIIASGSLGEALRYNDTQVFDKREAILNSLSKDGFFDLDFENLAKEELKLRLEIMLTWYRDLLAASAGVKDPSVFINADKREAIMREVKKFDMEKLEEIINNVILTNSFLDHNANPKLAMSALGLKILAGE